MKLIIFTIYDEKAEQFLPPFALPQKGMASRTFQDCVNDTSHAFGRNPADYTLFQSGEFCSDTGLLKGLDAKQSLGNGVEFITPLTEPESQALDRQNAQVDNPHREAAEAASSKNGEL